MTPSSDLLPFLTPSSLLHPSTPNAALVLGMIRRVVLSLSNAAVDKARKANLKSKFNTKSFQQRFRSAHGGRERLHALILAKDPTVLALPK